MAEEEKVERIRQLKEAIANRQAKIRQNNQDLKGATPDLVFIIQLANSDLLASIRDLEQELRLLDLQA